MVALVDVVTPAYLLDLPYWGQDDAEIWQTHLHMCAAVPVVALRAKSTKDEPPGECVIRYIGTDTELAEIQHRFDTHPWNNNGVIYIPAAAPTGR